MKVIFKLSIGLVAVVGLFLASVGDADAVEQPSLLLRGGAAAAALLDAEVLSTSSTSTAPEEVDHDVDVVIDDVDVDEDVLKQEGEQDDEESSSVAVVPPPVDLALLLEGRTTKHKNEEEQQQEELVPLSTRELQEEEYTKSCTADDCPDGEYCMFFDCVKNPDGTDNCRSSKCYNGSLDHMCDDTNPCQTGLFCVKGKRYYATCQNGTVGAFCDSKEDCNSGLFCSDQREDEESTVTQRCNTRAADGESCLLSSYSPYPEMGDCADGFVCLMQQGPYDYKCCAGSVGVSCDPAARNCQTGLFCSYDFTSREDVCTVGKEGDSCTTKDWEKMTNVPTGLCAPYHHCVNAKNSEYRCYNGSEGDPCSTNDDCSTCEAPICSVDFDDPSKRQKCTRGVEGDSCAVGSSRFQPYQQGTCAPWHDCVDKTNVPGQDALYEWKCYEIEYGPNVALGGTATQSSTAWEGVASLAVDGNTNGLYHHNGALGSVTHTAHVTNNWWQVIFKNPSNVLKVVIHNRVEDCCWSRLKDITVELLDSQEQVLETQTHAGPKTQYEVIAVYFPLTYASGVKIAMPREYLSLAEVEAYGPL